MNSVENQINEINGLSLESNKNGNGSIHSNGNGIHMNVNAITNSEFSFEKVKSIADWLLERVELRPKIGIVCGSGLGGLGDRLVNPKIIPYGNVPDFPKSTGKYKFFYPYFNQKYWIGLFKVVGHKGNLIFGLLNEVPVVCMQGRFHAYEGYSNALCTLPMKVFKLLGVDTVILTCAAGGINQTFEVGDIMLIKDHIAPLLWT